MNIDEFDGDLHLEFGRDDVMDLKFSGRTIINLCNRIEDLIKKRSNKKEIQKGIDAIKFLETLRVLQEEKGYRI